MLLDLKHRKMNLILVKHPEKVHYLILNNNLEKMDPTVLHSYKRQKIALYLVVMKPGLNNG